jgi:hypothetical protein
VQKLEGVRGVACLASTLLLFVGWLGTAHAHGSVECTRDDQCYEGNKCTKDTCVAGRCQHANVPDGTACSDGNACNGPETCQAGVCTGGNCPNCDDGNACTADRCDGQRGCMHEAIAGCTPCARNDQCADGNFCTTDVCTAGRCRHANAANGTSCEDGNACNGGETCQAGTCTAGSRLNCDDGDACTMDSCDVLAGCKHGSLSCDDGNPCTADSCDHATGCRHDPIPDCTTCGTVADCDDANACTAEACSDGVCRHADEPGCVSCASAADCNDEKACTTDRCTERGVCAHEERPGCVRCDGPEGCDDQDACTDDHCTGGVCSFAPIDNCCVPSVEVCGDGRDNDCDGLTDCDDPNCAAAPRCTPPTELCGDCKDNDGDGLIDYEDPDCCHQQLVLGLRNMKLRPTTTAKVSGDRLKLKALYAPFTPAGLDPLKQDTSVQISDGSGGMFCATIDHSHWMRRNRRTVSFWDMSGRFANGLSDGRFITTRDGSMIFRTHGRGMKMSPTDGHGLRVTVRVGDQCSGALTALRPKKSALVFP